MRLRAAFLLVAGAAVAAFSGCAHGRPDCRLTDQGEVCVTITCRDHQGRFVKCAPGVAEKECRP
jgi:hypothetical protein